MIVFFSLGKVCCMNKKSGSFFLQDHKLSLAIESFREIQICISFHYPKISRTNLHFVQYNLDALIKCKNHNGPRFFVSQVSML